MPVSTDGWHSTPQANTAAAGLPPPVGAAPAGSAELARGRLRAKTARLAEALNGRFTDHHALLLTPMLHRIDGISADIATVQASIEARIGERPRRWPGSTRSQGSGPSPRK